MFVVTERTRRRLCRTGFLVLCLLPTFCVSAWIGVSRLGGRHAAAEELLAARLGADVRIGAIATPQPGLLRYDDIAVADPQSQQLLLRAARLEMRSDRAATTATIEGGRIFATPRGLWPLLLRIATAGGRRPIEPLELVAECLTLQGAAGDVSLVEFKARFDPRGAAPALTISFRLSGRERSPLQTISVVGTAEGRAALKLDTGGAELPASVASLVWPSVARLGSAAAFRGTLYAELTDNGLSAQTAGRLSDVDLASLFDGLLPEETAIRGRAALTIDSARVRDGRLEQAAGDFQSGHGTVGPRFLEAAVATLGLVRHDLGRQSERESDQKASPQPERKPVPYGQLDFAFAIDAEGLRLSNRRDAPPRGAVLTGSTGEVLLSLGAAKPQPLTALARMFSAETEDWVPASRQSQWLLSRLPGTER